MNIQGSIRRGTEHRGTIFYSGAPLPANDTLGVSGNIDQIVLTGTTDSFIGVRQ